MNERTKELYARAVYNSGYVLDTFAEKFAELIVAECIDRCEFVAEMATITNTGEMARKTKATADSCALIIKQHFGVEEQEKVAPKPKCSVCGTTENVKYMGGYQPYLCDSVDCIPF